MAGIAAARTDGVPVSGSDDTDRTGCSASRGGNALGQLDPEVAARDNRDGMACSGIKKHIHPLPRRRPGVRFLMKKTLFKWKPSPDQTRIEGSRRVTRICTWEEALEGNEGLIANPARDQEHFHAAGF